MKKINTLTVNSGSKQEFLLKKEQSYFITQFINTSPNNPMADTIFKPLDSSKIEASVEILKDNSKKIILENNLDSGINIEIYEP